MIHHSKLLSHLIKWSLKLFVRSRAVSSEEVAAVADKPVVYVLEHSSAIDTLTLAKTAKELGLPSPYDDNCRVLYVHGHRFQRGHAGKLRLAIQSLLSAHQQDPQQDTQLLPITHFWGRSPEKTKGSLATWFADNPTPSWFRKIWMVVFLGRDHFIRFAPPVSIREFVNRYGDDETSVHRITRVARAHFYRQRLAATGPRLPNKQRMFKELSRNEAIRQITDADPAKQDSLRKNAQEYMEEIAATYSNSLVVVLDRFMTWLWNRLYRGINVNNIEQVRQLAESGKEIVYVPCHRSHMDYLLLSYVIYQQGLVPPHIAAGINLNFWPAGPIFRRGGAFFIRRSFRGNKLYSTVFREYLSWLIKEGFPVEYFSEGGRSRTGRLLTPKTGMLAMTVQSQLSSQSRPIVLVPIYLGYEHVMEVTTYLKELKGKRKEKESFFATLQILRKLRNYGQGYVNFGTPISLDDHLNAHAADWRQTGADERPPWLSEAVSSLANRSMIEVNNAAAINGLTITAMAILSNDNRAMSERSLALFLEVCLQLSRQARYHDNTTVPEEDGPALLSQTLELEKFTVDKDKLGNIVSLDPFGQVVMTYYRNNIIHLFVVPSLIAAMITERGTATKQDLVQDIEALFPLLQAELFLNPCDEWRAAYIEQIIASFETLKLIEVNHDAITCCDKRSAQHLQLQQLANIIGETMQRYSVVLELLMQTPDLSRSALESESRAIAEQLGRLHGINAPEFFDKQLFATLTTKMKTMGMLDQDEQAKDQLGRYHQLVSGLVSSDIHKSIEQLVLQPRS
ncbi:glycerol-3-phosphate 1-O-acyltransferase PlsB [Neiella marina]|uniref:Glycerol-3-phosphate acyltransferase n=1 Tax=Neiella holothuriorum TaxID=2870530 RepID=A0ABS7EFX7_9GAMM|nr:glycerol-3-phosphate 1-O-acyltransferase PlsB [Neiella holothuriorum]MBW8191230.1 glycerol-3-phosphate 1-O-acyltransferase PlsB [Neiella holothuriorum]